jgi:hypothetical protein
LTAEQADTQAAGAYLVGAMWWYAANVLGPVQALKRSGVPISSQVIGDAPEQLSRSGMGPRFSSEHDRPVLLQHGTRHDHLVA